METLPLSLPVFAIVSALIESHSGLHYGAEQRDLLADKISGPALDAGFTSLLDYYYFLRYDPAGPEALERLVNSLLVHETYFFREAEALRTLAEQVLMPRVAAGHAVRVWCAAAASGEEPLTLAMMLAEKGILGQVEIMATDLSQPALDRAQRGEFGGRSLRSLPESARVRFFEPRGDRLVIRSELRERVTWKRLNLMDGEAIEALGTFDAILCRNVLIYFDDKTVTALVQRLARALREGALLAVGMSESLLRYGTGLECREMAGSFFYTRTSL